MSDDQPVYLSYLLRLWSTSADRERVWRASLKSPLTGQRHSFATLYGLRPSAATDGRVLRSQGGDERGRRRQSTLGWLRVRIRTART